MKNKELILLALTVNALIWPGGFMPSNELFYSNTLY